MQVYYDDTSAPIGGGPVGEPIPPPPPPPADSDTSAPIGGRHHRRRGRWAAALGAVLILATLLACSGGPDGSCTSPTPCGSVEGRNP